MLTILIVAKKHAPIEAGDAWTQGALKLGWPKIEDSSNPGKYTI